MRALRAHSGAGSMRAQFVRKGERAPARLALLSGTALVSASLCVALVGSMRFAPTAAFADGGCGGGGEGGGAVFGCSHGDHERPHDRASPSSGLLVWSRYGLGAARVSH